MSLPTLLIDSPSRLSHSESFMNHDSPSTSPSTSGSPSTPFLNENSIPNSMASSRSSLVFSLCTNILRDECERRFRIQEEVAVKPLSIRAPRPRSLSLSFKDATLRPVSTSYQSDYDVWFDDTPKRASFVFDEDYEYDYRYGYSAPLTGRRVSTVSESYGDSQWFDEEPQTQQQPRASVGTFQLSTSTSAEESQESQALDVAAEAEAEAGEDDTVSLIESLAGTSTSQSVSYVTIDSASDADIDTRTISSFATPSETETESLRTIDSTTPTQDDTVRLSLNPRISTCLDDTLLWNSPMDSFAAMCWDATLSNGSSSNASEATERPLSMASLTRSEWETKLTESLSTPLSTFHQTPPSQKRMSLISRDDMDLTLGLKSGLGYSKWYGFTYDNEGEDEDWKHSQFATASRIERPRPSLPSIKFGESVDYDYELDSDVASVSESATRTSFSTKEHSSRSSSHTHTSPPTTGNREAWLHVSRKAAAILDLPQDTIIPPLSIFTYDDDEPRRNSSESWRRERERDMHRRAHSSLGGMAVQKGLLGRWRKAVRSLI